ncbi:MAG: hypothetical protein IPJ02_03520 [Chitinophagaceae bacterium]|nr:hypothetical protein [Chitinophagaceae bacterium]
MKTFFLIWSLSAYYFVQKEPSLNGVWVSVDDKKATIIFKGQKYYSLYDTDTVRTGSFKRSVRSCDAKYMNSTQKADFILLISKLDETCFEITGLSNSTLAYRHTNSGKLHVFQRK